jgi:hypothetical protein
MIERADSDGPARERFFAPISAEEKRRRLRSLARTLSEIGRRVRAAEAARAQTEGVVTAGGPG